MQRNKTRFSKLRTTNREDSLCPVHILRLEIDGLTQPQTGHRQQAKQAVIRMRLQLVRRFNFERRFQEATDFFYRVEVRSCPLGSEPQQPDRGDFGPWITAYPVTRKTTDDAKSAGPRDRLFVLALSGILHRELVRYVRRSVLLEEGHE